MSDVSIVVETDDNAWMKGLYEARKKMSILINSDNWNVPSFTFEESKDSLNHYCLSCGSRNNESFLQYRVRVDGLKDEKPDDIEGDAFTYYSVDKESRGYLCQFCKEDKIVVYRYDTKNGKRNDTHNG